MINSPISCIVLNYNDAQTTIRLVESIRTYQIFHSIIVIDNCSTDDSVEQLKKISDSKTIILCSKKNGGYGYGNNVGIRYVVKHFSDDCFIIANPDVLFEEQSVIDMVELMRSNERCGMISCVQNGDPVTSAWKDTDLLGDQLFNNILLNRVFKPRYYDKSYFEKGICEVYAISGCFFLANTKAFLEIGLYDEDFFLFEEEKCIAKKLKDTGWKSYLITYHEFIHDHSVSIKKSLKKLGEGKKAVLKSNRLYLKKYLHISPLTMIPIRIYHGICHFEQVIWDFVKPRLSK